MKRFFIGVFLLCSIIFIIPSVMIPVSMLFAKDTPLPVMADTVAEETGDAITTSTIGDSYEITLYQAATGEIVTLDFEDYITGVLAEEMPPTNHIEALKAQAVAARSYILSKIADYTENGIPESHHGAMLCTDLSHCRPWRSFEETQSLWDSRFAEDYAEKIKKAVSATRGEYLVYDNKVVKAFFYAVSSGKTEDVSDVWGVSLPYLKSVDSAEDARADGYRSRVFYPKDAFFTVLRGLRPNLQVDEGFSDTLCQTKCHDSGSVDTVEIFGEAFTGAEIQKAFRLRSTVFSLRLVDGQAVFDVKGYGHGVGMSQFGANAMANNGKTYQEILCHYYTDVKLACLYHKA